VIKGNFDLKVGDWGTDRGGQGGAAVPDGVRGSEQ